MRVKSDFLRSISDREVRTIKKATEAAYHLAGGVSVVATRTRASISQLSKYASTNLENSETLIPLDVAIEVDRAAGDFVLLRAYAELFGQKVVAAGPEDGCDDAAVSELDAHVIARNAMSLSEEIFKALEDGKIDALERSAIADKCYLLKRAARRLIKRMGGDA